MRRLAIAAVAILSFAACRKAVPKARAPEQRPPPVDEAALDRSVSPCSDFYRFACGGWLDATEIPPDRASWSRGFTELQERNMGELRGILDTAGAGKLDPSVRFGDKLGAFWATCMDEASVEAHGLADLRSEWARIDAIPGRPALAIEIARLEGGGAQAPFEMFADQDAKDATQVILSIVQSGLSLPDRDYYLSDDPKKAEIRTAYDAHLRKMLALAGVAPPDAAAQAATVERIERTIAESHWTRTEMRDPVRVYNRVDRSGLEKLAPAFPWGPFFDTLRHPGLAAVNVTTPRFVETVGSLFAKAPIDDWKAYLRWHVLEEMADARAVPKAFVDERFAFTSRSFTGAKELMPRWKHCVQMTDEGIGFALGQAYVHRFFGAEAKDRTTRLVAEIERSMGRDIDALPWMDAATKKAAELKLSKVVNKVGYPATWRDYSTMTFGRDSYFQNVLAAARFETNRQFDKVGKPLDRTEWFMTPPTVNAYYNPSMNEMVFPAGILQPPFWNTAAPESVNYGAIGMVVGHELTHGFDDEGRKYDGDGNLRDWWTPQVAKEFDGRARCVVDQYSGYESVPGVKLNGELTLGENIADLGGLKLAFAAMRAASAGQPPPAKVAGFDAAQQFFIGYAQSWCSKFREENLRLRAVTDPHSPPQFRVNGPLSDMPEFAAAFGCPAGSTMVRPAQTRCAVW